MLRFVAIAFVMRLCRDRGRLARSFARRCVARLVRERAGGTPAVQSKSAVADFDRFIEWPKPAYTRFRLGEGRIAEGNPGWGGGDSVDDSDAVYAEALSPPPGPLARADLPPAEPRYSEGSAT